MRSTPTQLPLEPAAEREVRELGPILDLVGPLTTTPRDALIDLARLVRAVLRFNVPGAIVECGSWCGGAGFLMAELLRQAGARDRKVWLFDSFEGLPPPQEVDGPSALEYAADTDSPDYRDNLRASFEEVRRTAAELGLAPYTECVKGWFEETLPAWRERIGPIALLRVDGNWYASVRCCLEALGDQVVDEGFIIFHTYYTYDGCAKAAHEFLAGRGLPYRIEAIEGKRSGETTEDYQSALVHKGETTWKWLRHVYLATQDLEAVVPPGATLILAGGNSLGAVFDGGRRARPFPESEGEYGGPPEDDATAVQELRRQCRAGAGFLAFAWPDFWWLDYYAEFHRHLRAAFPCTLENERVLVFDLRKDPLPS
jgi:O-methyltransferase